MVQPMFRGEMEQAAAADDDLRLLRRYAADGCARSFEAVVRRHIAWVYSSSLRQVAGDAHLAEEVTQAVFVLLARRAGSLHEDTLVTGWLFNTLRFTAKEARRKEARRRRHESAAALAPQTPAPEGIDRESWEAMAPLLDQAVASLKESDRQAVLLRFYEGRDFADIARILGLAEPAARKRVSRAVERLGRYFKKRGITRPTALTLALLLLLTRSSEGAPLAPTVAQLLRRISSGFKSSSPAAKPRDLSRGHTTRGRLVATLAASIALLALLTTLVAWLADAPPPVDPRDFATPTPVDAWPGTGAHNPLTNTLELPAPSGPTRATVSEQPAPRPITDRPTHPLPNIDAAWWVRQWFDPAGGPATPQARTDTPIDSAIDPATGQPRAAPRDYVESNAQMGGGGGGSTAMATARPLGPVAGEINGAPSSSHTASAPSDATTTSTRIAAVVETIVADSADSPAGSTPASPVVSGTLTPVHLAGVGSALRFINLRDAATGTWYLFRRGTAVPGEPFTVLRRYLGPDGSVDVAVDGLVPSDLGAIVFASPDPTSSPTAVMGPTAPPILDTVPIAYVQTPEPATPLLLLTALALPRAARHTRRR